MFITKMALPRRTFLRGIGATLALPLLDAMVPGAVGAGEDGAAPVRRLGFIYTPNGATMAAWTPKGEGPVLDELSPSLCPLDAVQGSGARADRPEPAAGRVVGRRQRRAFARPDGVAERRASEAHRRRRRRRRRRPSIRLPRRRSARTRALLSLEMALEQNYLVGNCDNGYSCVYWNTISWRTPTTPLPMEVNPRIVFERMFGDGGSPAQRLAQVREDRSILDSVTRSRGRASQQRLGAGDRVKVAEYLDSMREIERRIQVAERQSGESLIALPDRPIGMPETYDEHAKLMFDLAALAFQADITRVFTLLLGREQTNRPYPFIGVPEAHHAISHHQNDPAEARQGREDQHVPHRAARALRREAEGDAGRRRHAARQLDDPAGQRPQQLRSALAHRPAAGPRRRRRRAAQGRASSAVPEGHADEQPAPGDAREGRRAGREARRQHRDRSISHRWLASRRGP